MDKVRESTLFLTAVKGVKILLSSYAIYKIFDAKVEELFWIIAGIIFLAYLGLEKRNREAERELRQKILFGFVSCYIAACLVLGQRFYEEIQHSMAEWIIIFAGLFLLIHEGMYCLYDWLCQKLCRKPCWNLCQGLCRRGRGPEDSKLSRFQGEFLFLSHLTKGKRIFLAGFLLFLGWMPMLLANYPGFMMYDSSEQWYQAVGEWSLNNHHPIWHTMFIRFGVWLCRLICGEIVPEYGVLICSLMQMAIMAAVFALVAEWLYEGVHTLIWLGSFLYYLFFPFHSIQSVSMVKDSLFGTFVLLFTAQVYKLYCTDGEWGKSWKNIFGMSLTMLGVVFLRNNGFAVILVTGPVLFLLYKSIRKQIFAAGVFVMICFVLQNTVIFHAFDIRQTQLAEAIGIPINQIANIVVHDRALTENEKTLIEAVMPLEEIKENYNIHYSDSIKFNENYRGYVIEQSKKTFLKLWITLLCKYPADCMEASLNLTVGFWYPGVGKGAVSLGMEEKDLYLKEIGVNTEGLKVRSNIFDGIMGAEIRDSVLFSGFLSIGNVVILMLVLCSFTAVKGKWKAASVFFPCIAVWLTLLMATPSYCDTRYIYSIFTALPVMAAVFGNTVYIEEIGR